MTIPMPLSMLKSASFWKLLGLDDQVDLDSNKEALSQVVTLLDKYKKINGTFTLIEIKESTGDGIRIEI